MIFLAREEIERSLLLFPPEKDYRGRLIIRAVKMSGAALPQRPTSENFHSSFLRGVEVEKSMRFLWPQIIFAAIFSEACRSRFADFRASRLSQARACASRHLPLRPPPDAIRACRCFQIRWLPPLQFHRSFICFLGFFFPRAFRHPALRR